MQSTKLQHCWAINSLVVMLSFVYLREEHEREGNNSHDGLIDFILNPKLSTLHLDSPEVLIAICKATHVFNISTEIYYDIIYQIDSYKIQ